MATLVPRSALGGALALAASAALAWLVLQPGGDVARAQHDGSTPVLVSAFGCLEGLGGRRFVPAGSEIVIRQGYASSAAGGVKPFLDVQTTALSVDDARMIDVSDAWFEVDVPPPAALARVEHPTGVTLWEPGDSMRFTFALVFERPLLDPSDYDGDGKLDPNLGGPGLAFGGTCTVTAF
jgi:hypothetical protein